MAIRNINVSSWEEFESRIELDISSLKEQKIDGLYQSRLLFRGQSNVNWKLETTLERYLKDRNLPYDRISEESYAEKLESTINQHRAFSNELIDYPEKISGDRKNIDFPNAFDYLVHLRHDGFPSPILDWTVSPYVAAYFAFKDASVQDKDENRVIYSLCPIIDGSFTINYNSPTVFSYEGDLRTHRRHYIQQANYTYCQFTEYSNGIERRYYTSHEDARFNDNQNYIKKYILPFSERKKILKKLDSMNINALTLFGNEEGLANMLAYREIEKGSL